MIRVGIGGWNFAPWRETFYPKGVSAAKELSYASGKVTTIEINGTFYRTQSATSFAKWRDETPDGFVFAVKGHRSVVSKANLADGGESVAWFLESGLAELGDKLGPLLWQMPHTKKFRLEEIAGFLAALPKELAGRPLRHAIEPRHATFVDPAFIDIARGHGVAIVYADNAKYPRIADVTAPFVYARLQNALAEEETGYSAVALDGWTSRAKEWAAGGAPSDLPLVGLPPPAQTRDVFVYMINGAKERAPAAAMAMLGRL